jgi:hypothetical protein
VGESHLTSYTTDKLLMVGESVRVSEDDGEGAISGCVKPFEILLDSFFVYKT